MNNGVRTFLKALIPLVVLMGAVFATIWLVKTKPKPKRREVSEIQTTVTVQPAILADASVKIQAGGTVLPSRQVDLRPQVMGQIIEISDELRPGGYFEEGRVMLRIDPRDYEFAVARQKAELARAEFEVKQELGNQAIAKREWELLGKQMESTPEGRELALRTPHLIRAEAVLEGARSGLAEAQLNLERTVIRAPFNALVRQENADKGQLITQQNVIASLTGTDRYWIRATVPVDALGFINLPDIEGNGGSKAQVVHQSGQTRVEKTGSIIQLLGDLDQAGRMARLLIAIDDPHATTRGENQLPLLLDAFVRVEIQGKLIKDVFVLNPAALHEGDEVWVMNNDNRLEIRKTEIVWKEENRVLVRGGLTSGDRVITSRIATPVPGMSLKKLEKDGNQLDLGVGPGVTHD